MKSCLLHALFVKLFNLHTSRNILLIFFVLIFCNFSFSETCFNYKWIFKSKNQYFLICLSLTWSQKINIKKTFRFSILVMILKSDKVKFLILNQKASYTFDIQIKFVVQLTYNPCTITPIHFCTKNDCIYFRSKTEN